MLSPKLYVKPIFLLLDEMADVDEREIADLEAELDRLRVEVANADLPGKVSVLEEEVRRQNTTLADYDMQIGQLRADIVNLQEIEQAIPTKCNSVLSVEQD